MREVCRMPFDKPFPKPFTETSVRKHAPAVSGVYGISNAGDWIYIGETDNIQGALLMHLREVEQTLQRWHPTGFVFEICELALRASRQNRLVLEYEPAWNRHWTWHR